MPGLLPPDSAGPAPRPVVIGVLPTASLRNTEELVAAARGLLDEGADLVEPLPVASGAPDPTPAWAALVAAGIGVVAGVGDPAELRAAVGAGCTVLRAPHASAGGASWVDALLAAPVPVVVLGHPGALPPTWFAELPLGEVSGPARGEAGPGLPAARVVADVGAAGVADAAARVTQAIVGGVRAFRTPAPRVVRRACYVVTAVEGAHR